MTTIKDVIRHIKSCDKRMKRYDWLGFVENKELSPEVTSLFSFQGVGMAGYDWVNGNERLNNLILAHHQEV